MTKKQVDLLLKRMDFIKFFGTYFVFTSSYDKKAYKTLKSKSRIYIQVHYNAVCTKTGVYISCTGRKWYLSDHMTADEVVKTAYVAFKTAVEHEIMEAFKVDGKILFNPHVNFEELLRVSDKEVTRKPKR